MSIHASTIPDGARPKNGEWGTALRHDTLMFNGYGEEVASLYSGMDLARDY
jgi:hypothetical protein